MILDASALLAYLNQEQGGASVKLLLPVAFMSTVNWCEVVQKLRKNSIDDTLIAKKLTQMGLRFIPFSVEHANKAGELWQATAPFGLSLGDRACIATGLVENRSVITADRIWQDIPLSVDIRLIR